MFEKLKRWELQCKHWASGSPERRSAKRTHNRHVRRKVRQALKIK